MTRRRTIVAAAAAAVVVVAVPLVAANLVDRERETHAAGAAAVERLFRGVPQRGLALGRAGAPVTLVVFADLQCPFCAEWSRTALPGLVERYVRRGRLRIVFRGLAFIGPDSERGLRAVLAAGLQDRLWHLSELLFRRQAPENSGWLSRQLVVGAARDVPELDVDLLLRDLRAPAVEREIAAAARVAKTFGIRATPSFLVGRTSGPLRRVDVGDVARQLERLVDATDV